jgi:tetratricopeptide (TPR) repeat protein
VVSVTRAGPRLPWASLILFLSLQPATAQNDPKLHSSWWQSTYGEIQSSRNLYTARAKLVFDRLVAVADKRANRLPRLLLVAVDGDPYAVALPDGGVVLTKSGLDLCYSGVSPPYGDARLAFVLGHELAHLANDDFWHAAAFSVFITAGPERSQTRSLAETLRDRPSNQQVRELQADANGLVYMMMSGFEPQVLLLGNDSFFHQWARLAGDTAYADPNHPTPDERASLLRAELAKVASELPFFYFGIRLYQIGRYQEAILLLDRFRTTYPGREVLNNAGLAHYQLAARILGDCDGDALLRFYLPVVLDPETRARVMRVNRSEPSPCFRSADFRKELETSARLFSLAAESAPEYIPARINLTSTWILGQMGPQAYVAARAASELAPKDASVRMLEAVALYLLGREGNLDTGPESTSRLAKLTNENPNSPAIAYNLGAILAEQNRSREARSAWQGFRRLESTGVYAEAVSAWLNNAASTPSHTREPQELKSMTAPSVPLGRLDNRVIAQLREWTRTPLSVGSLQGAVYEKDGRRALELDGAIVMVDEQLSGPGMSELITRLGPPIQTIPMGERRFLRYRGIGFELAGETVQRAVHFASP